MCMCCVRRVFVSRPLLIPGVFRVCSRVRSVVRLEEGLFVEVAFASRRKRLWIVCIVREHEGVLF